MKYVIVDVDAGSDDALALMVLLAGENSQQYKIIAITCTYGNTTIDNVCRNVCLVLESVNRQDIPVFKGSAKPILGKIRRTLFHGEDGFGDKDFSAPKIEIQTENAISAIQRLTEEYPGLTFISLGPLTNLAVAVRSSPKLSESIGDIWIMGGNTSAVGNVAGTTAEFNFHQDPEAAQMVLSSFQCTINILPWEPCINSPYSVDWRFKTLGASNKHHMILLNLVEEDLYRKSTCWNPCDALLTAAFISSQAISAARRVSMTVELCGTFTRGQCVLLKEPTTNVRVIDQLNYDFIRRVLLDLAQFDFKK